jgi:hypothetical protein
VDVSCLGKAKFDYFAELCAGGRRKTLSLEELNMIEMPADYRCFEASPFLKLSKTHQHGWVIRF